MVLTGHVVLVDAAALDRLTASADPPTIIDVRWRLGGPPTRSDFLDGHIPTAAFLDLDAELCGPPGPAGRHPLPDPDALQAALRRAGVRTGHPVVVYDNGDLSASARTWWTLRWAGHTDVRVLDGGYPAWLAYGGAVEAGATQPPLGDVVVTPGQLPVLDAAGAELVAQTGTLLDARIPARFRGETEPIDPVAGHIPGAVNLPTADLVGPDGRLNRADELRAVLDRVAAPGPVGAYCGSGVTAATTLLALHLAGFDEAALYVGSWSNWITDPRNPVAVGA
jgi:thiosulfate/3-mercaptopyruvate sulfurtransferase